MGGMTATTALMGWGQVRHTRHRPAHHAFAYPTAFLMLPMRTLQAGQGQLALAVNRPAWFAFHDVDHGDGRSPQAGGALAWLDELLQREGIVDATGEVWLQAFPRVLGHAFKPVSFWYAHRPDGRLAAIVAEVNNTFGERHCYLLPEPHYGQTLLANKVFHVSPFCAVHGEYRFRFMRTEHDGQHRIVARVDHADEQGRLIDTSWSGVLEPASAKALRRVMWRYPLLTLGVVARIHWHALLLWIKKVPFWRKPEPPRDFVTR
jgi:DUF1365 family protein